MQKIFSRISEILVCIGTCPKWLELVLAYTKLKPLSFPYLFETRRGQKVVLNTRHDLVTAWVVFIRGEYFVPRESKMIIDAGANIGCFTIFAAWEAPDAKIIAFEPFPATCQALKKNLALNGLQRRVTVYQLALGANNGFATMESNPDVPSQSIGAFESNALAGIQVPMKTLATAFRECGISEVDLFKMDIEGGEHPIFENFPKEEFSKIRHFSLEYHPNGHFSHIVERLSSAGLKMTENFCFHENSGVAWFERVDS